MPDALFSEPRLAEVYDEVDGERDDLDAYVALADELGARSVLDVGCGTGCLALLLAERGLAVVGVDPAAASLAVARAKPGAEQVRWVRGEVAATDGPFDLAVMTGNVAQVFTTDEEWSATLAGVHAALRPGGHLAFEARRPEARAWEGWDGQRHSTPEMDVWCEVLAVALPLVTFRWSYDFAADDAVLTSESTLRFRSEAELTGSLVAAGFVVDEVREATDRPGLEMVFVTHRPG